MIRSYKVPKLALTTKFLAVFDNILKNFHLKMSNAIKVKNEEKLNLKN